MARVKTDDAVCDFATLEFAADIDHECKTTSVDKFVGDKCDAQFHRRINGRSVPGLRRSIVLRGVQRGTGQIRRNGVQRGTGQIRRKVKENEMELGSRVQEVLVRHRWRGWVANKIGRGPESRTFSAKQSARCLAENDKAGAMGKLFMVIWFDHTQPSPLLPIASTGHPSMASLQSASSSGVVGCLNT